MLQADTIRREGQADAKLRRVHHFSDNQGTDGRYTDALGSFSDCLAGYKAAVHDKGDSLFCFSCLQISQDDVELVHKLMVEGTQRIQGCAGSGQLVRHSEHLSPVVQNHEDALYRILFYYGNCLNKKSAAAHIGNQAGDGEMGCICPIPESVPGQQAGTVCIRKQCRQLFFFQTVRHASAAEQIGCRLIGKQHPAGGIGGYEPFLQGAENGILTDADV